MERLEFHVSEKTLDRIDALAEDLDIQRSALIRQMVRENLRKYERMAAAIAAPAEDSDDDSDEDDDDDSDDSDGKEE